MTSSSTPGDAPRTDDDRQKAAKARLLQKITPLDSDVQQLAEELRQLPRVAPRGSFAERLRARLVHNDQPIWLTALLRQGMAFGIILLLVVGVSLTTFVAQVTPTLAEEVARLTVHDGTVKIRDAAALFYRSAVNGDIVRVGDTVRVERGSLASLSFPDSSTVALNAGTEVSVTSAEGTDTPIISQLKPGKKGSAVKLALITGEVTTTSAKKPDAVQLEIATPSGVVSGVQASFAVKIEESGEATVTTSDEQVTVTPTTGDGVEAAVEVGQTATLDAGAVTVVDAVIPDADSAVVAAEPAGPAPEAIKTEIDILRIRLFDALAAAQAGDMTTAHRIEEGVTIRLDKLFRELGTDPVSEKRIETLQLLLPQVFLESPEIVATMQGYLTMMDVQQSLLGVYAVAPQTLRDEPAFDILTGSRYQPSGELRRLFTAARAHNLAIVSARPIANELLALTAREYGASLTGRTAAAHTTQLLAEMGDQPLYLPALRLMRWTAAADVRYLIDRKVIALERVLAKYRGEVPARQTVPSVANDLEGDEQKVDADAVEVKITSPTNESEDTSHTPEDAAVRSTDDT